MYQKSSNDIRNQIETFRKQQVLENIERLVPIIEFIILHDQ